MPRNNKKEYTQRYRKLNPDKARAHWVVQEALRKGDIFKLPCEKCKSLRVHAHHDDYSKPLQIRWLCVTCHELEHHGETKLRVYPRIPKELWKPRNLTRDQKRRKYKAQASELRDKGVTYREIADIFEVSVSSVYKWLNETRYI